MSDISAAQSASRELISLAPHCDLQARQRMEVQLAEDDIAKGALATVTGYEPTTWSMVRFRLWREVEPEHGPNRQIYRVGHLSS